MKKIIIALVIFLVTQQNFAQVINAGAIITLEDPSITEARKSNKEKMIAVLSLANGFIDENPIETKSSFGTKGYYQATNKNVGFIFYNSSLKISTFSYGPTRAKHLELGLEQGKLGFPTTDATFIKSGAAKTFGTYTLFEGGAIAVKAGVASALTEPIFKKYNDMGGVKSKLGFPISDYMIAHFLKVDDYTQRFENGAFWGTKANAYYMYGDLWKKYNKAKHGLPLADQQDNVTTGAASLKCEKGLLVYSAKTGVFLVQGAIQKKFNDLGGLSATSKTGLPTSEEAKGDAMTAQNFEKGLILLVNGKATFVPDDSPENKNENLKIIEKLKIITPVYKPIYKPL